MKNESGKTLTEILAVLAIIGVLSLVGLYAYSVSMRKKTVDTILDTLQQKTIEIDSALANRDSKNINDLNDFLKGFTTTVGSYQLSFHSVDNSDTEFVSEVTYIDGSKIKGAFCRELIRKMMEQNFISDIDFTLKDEELEDGTIGDVTVQLNGKSVDLDALCGG